jgi:hypothetical protein
MQMTMQQQLIPHVSQKMIIAVKPVLDKLVMPKEANVHPLFQDVSAPEVHEE